MTRQNWHWDLNLSEAKLRGILAREADPRFARIAGVLLSRMSDPKEVFQWITPIAFCRHWRRLQREIQSDAWTKERASFWKATYLRLSKELRQSGVKIRQPEALLLDRFDKDLADKIRECRKKALMTQKELAQFMGCNQQFISNIEKGRERPNLDFLKKVAQITHEPLELVFRADGEMKKEPAEKGVRL